MEVDMYSIETLRKVVALMNERGAEIDGIPVEQVKLCISKGNVKIGKVMNVSLPPILSCANCSGCSRLCYDIKACAQYPNTVISARMRNYSILKRDRARYFALIEQAISRRRKNKYFRWHVAGDIVDIDYFDNMVRIAREHDDFTFWTYTKNYRVVNAWCAEHGRENIPRNFSIMFSEWRGMPMDNPYHFPEFSVLFDGEKCPRGAWSCNLDGKGNCENCLAAHRGCPFSESVYCDVH
jgi:hypothetical protein